MSFDILGKPIPDATPKEKNAALIALAEQWGLPCDILIRHKTATEPPPKAGVYLGYWMCGTVPDYSTIHYNPNFRNVWTNLAREADWCEPDYWFELPQGLWPECPRCGEMPYSETQCQFCGQRFTKEDEPDATV